MALVMGVDSSTQSCKVQLRDAETGALVGSGSADHPATRPPVSEQSASSWWNALIVAFERAVASAGVRKSDVAAISVAGQCHGLVLMDDLGQVLRPVKLWNDLTSAPQAQAMVAEAGPKYWADQVGSVPPPAFTITKLAWMAANEPDVLAATSQICLPHDWLTWRLSGQLVTDRSEASGTGYYAAWDNAYRYDILRHFGGVEADILLPQVLGPDTPVGSISTQAANELGLVSSVVIGPGAGDQHAAALGMGLQPGDIAFSLGTSGVVMAVSDGPVHDAGGVIDGVCDATGRYLPLVCVLNAATVTDWFRNLLGVSVEQFDELALSVGPESRTVTLAAYFDGERRPNLPYANGLLAGLTTATSRAELARAAVDGVVMGLLEGLDAIRGYGIATNRRVLVVGAPSASAAYRQSLADFLQRPVMRIDTPSATARGACLQAAAVLHGVAIDEIRNAWPPTVVQVTEPGPMPTENLRAAYRRLTAFRDMDAVPNR